MKGVNKEDEWEGEEGKGELRDRGEARGPEGVRGDEEKIRRRDGSERMKN